MDLFIPDYGLILWNSLAILNLILCIITIIKLAITILLNTGKK